MPVTFHPSTESLSAVPPYILNQAATDPLAFLTGCNGQVAENCKELFQSSFEDIGKASHPTIPVSNGFVDGAVQAYNTHQHLIIRPEDVWITILSQFNLFVNANAEELRHLFVRHEGKKELSIITGGSRYTVNFGKLAEQFSHLIQQNVLDENLRAWIIPDFTTTTDNDRVVSSIVMMATLKAYFDYSIGLMCGLPAVTLLGEKKDWVKLSEKAEHLQMYGKETSQWYALLKPVLSGFVAAFDKPNSSENTDFWQKIAHREGGGSGPTYLSGWITAFTFFSKKGKSLYTNTDGLQLDGVKYHQIDMDDIPPAYAEVNVKLDDNGQAFKTIMVAGVVGYRVLDSGTAAGEHSGKQDTLQPVTGWWMFHEKGIKPAAEND